MAEIEVRRTIRAPRAAVYEAWTSEAYIRQWWPPVGTTPGPIVVEPRQGGRMELGIVPPEGPAFSALGRFRTVEPPALLEFTWRWSHGMDVPETLVRVEFHERSAGETEVVLKHTGFPNVDAAASHEDGWTNCLTRLGSALVFT